MIETQATPCRPGGGEMTREQRIIETFVELADTVVDDFDVVEFLHRLAERCVELLDCTEAGLLLADAAGVLRVMASSSERSDALDLLQTQNDEGPCFECFHRGEPVSSNDLTDEFGQWPARSGTTTSLWHREWPTSPRSRSSRSAPCGNRVGWSTSFRAPCRVAL